MEKVEEKIIEEKRKIHKFYCDRCGEYLGEVKEYYDGCCKEIGRIFERIVINGTPYYYKGNLCSECKEEHYKELSNLFETIGFVKK
jgi:formylmethanofuran dehydrogenase subunit E